LATPDQSQLDQFHIDRQLLPYNDSEIAKRLKVGRSNYSKRINGHITITREFLAKFNKEFGPELDIIREQLDPYQKNKQIPPEIAQLLANMENRLTQRIEKSGDNIAQMVAEFAKKLERLILPLTIETNKDILADTIAGATKEYLNEKALEKRLNKKPIKKTAKKLAEKTTKKSLTKKTTKKNPPKKRKPK